MNSASGKRLISRQEALVLLGGLDLVHCSDTIKTVSLTGSKQLHGNDEDSKVDKTILSDYKKRDKSLAHLSLYEYFHMTHEKCLGSQKQIIPHFVGISGFPTYPVSENYAKQTIIVHKPRFKHPESDDWKGEFENFIRLPDTPKGPKIMYYRAMQRHFEGKQFVEAVASKPNLTMHGIDEKTAELLDLTGMIDSSDICYDAALLNRLDRGEDFAWDKERKVIIIPQILCVHYRILAEYISNWKFLSVFFSAVT